MKIVRTAVAEIEYLESGHSDGFPVLFLHGFPDDAHTWDRVVAEVEGLPAFCATGAAGRGGAALTALRDER